MRKRFWGQTGYQPVSRECVVRNTQPEPLVDREQQAILACLGPALTTRVIRGGIETGQNESYGRTLYRCCPAPRSRSPGIDNSGRTGDPPRPAGIPSTSTSAATLARNPCIVLLDEATNRSAIKSQASLTERIRNPVATRIVIAHRVSTTREVPHVYSFEAGESRPGRVLQRVGQPGWPASRSVSVATVVTLPQERHRNSSCGTIASKVR